MRKDTNKAKPGRRDFLKLASIGAVAAGVAGVTGQKAEAKPDAEEKRSGYRLTHHVKKVYELARF